MVGLTTAGALLLAWRFDSKVAETAATALLAAGPLYIAWKAFKHDRVEAAAVDLTAVTDRLADAVRTQWEAEAEVRRVNDPYPLPVAWRAADPDLVESWELLTDLARTWPGGPPNDPARWPADADGLADSDARIGEVFSERVPTRRLVVLGEPGAGKSVLLIHLLQDLIARRPAGGPVPVLFSLASWNPNQQRLQEWMADQLRRAHPGLHNPASAPASAVTSRPEAHDLARELLDARLILPLLDGFDELPPALHAVALDAINRALPAKQPLVLAARSAEYRAAVARSDAVVRLNGAAGIHLLPVTQEQAADYLRRDAGGSHTPAARRWDAVTAHLGTDTPVGQALGTPLGLFLARTIYNPRPQVVPPSAPVPHPDELCDTTVFPDRATVDRHLFNAFIPAAYTPRGPSLPRWSVAQARRTLTFLARHLELDRGGTADLAWWELHHATPTPIRRLMVGLVLGLLVAFLGGLVSEFLIGLMSGLLIGLVFGLRGSDANAPSVRLRWSPSTSAAVLRLGLVFGLFVGLLVGITVGFVSGLTIGLAFWLAIGFVGGFMAGLTTEEPDLTTTVGPAALLAQDRRIYLTGGLVLGLLLGSGLGLAVGFATGDMAVFPFGLALGLMGGLPQTAWTGWGTAKLYLVVRHRLPWHLMAFLQDAHQRGVLRQVGPVYQFRHIDLQRHLAQQPWPPAT
ncbi:NACHT domain-containing protein [Streptomyces macrosporus]|uniref:NACHT domain-containing protein n=1 Tax=Streptomyces macrosporus TaxID=44032 RepID=UPI0031E33926